MLPKNYVLLMDFTPKKTNPNPVKNSNPISRGLFLWTIPLFLKGRKQDLTVDDLYDVRASDTSKKVGDQLELFVFS